MNKSHHRTWIEGKIRYLLSLEEQLLQAISTHAPLPGLLHGICSALDCQIGNVISLISLTGDDISEFAPIAIEAATFGLYSFHSGVIFVDQHEGLGYLEMYCCIPLCPSSERAKCAWPPLQSRLITMPILSAIVAGARLDPDERVCSSGQFRRTRC